MTHLVCPKHSLHSKCLLVDAILTIWDLKLILNCINITFCILQGKILLFSISICIEREASK
jgi:hypothetical protein